jgi:hypothetical protein
MVITQGSGAASTTICVVAFHTAWTSTPVCVATYNGAAAPAASVFAVNATTTTLTIYSNSTQTGKTINVICQGYK